MPSSADDAGRAACEALPAAGFSGADRAGAAAFAAPFARPFAVCSFAAGAGCAVADFVVAGFSAGAFSATGFCGAGCSVATVACAPLPSVAAGDVSPSSGR